MLLSGWEKEFFREFRTFELAFEHAETHRGGHGYISIGSGQHGLQHGLSELQSNFCTSKTIGQVWRRKNSHALQYRNAHTKNLKLKESKLFAGVSTFIFGFRSVASRPGSRQKPLNQPERYERELHIGRKSHTKLSVSYAYPQVPVAEMSSHPK
jgi:hypothetical protein